MSELYQIWDSGLIDYQLYQFHGLWLRGPKHECSHRIAFVGAAQTFGRFCPDPFPTILGSRLNMGVLNFGIGGKGPSYFTESTTIMDAVNQSKLVIVQVMSARSVSNSVFAVEGGGRDGIRRTDQKGMTAEAVYDDLVCGRDVRGYEEGFVERLFAETRCNYVREMNSLLKAIRPPKILFWLSVRAPNEKVVCSFSTHGQIDMMKGIASRLNLIPRFERVGGQFPHLVDAGTIAQIIPHSDAYVECVMSTGLPEIRFNRAKKRLVWNNYYPSAAMHLQGADLLYPVCRRLLNYIRPMP